MNIFSKLFWRWQKHIARKAIHTLNPYALLAAWKGFTFVCKERDGTAVFKDSKWNLYALRDTDDAGFVRLAEVETKRTLEQLRHKCASLEENNAILVDQKKQLIEKVLQGETAQTRLLFEKKELELAYAALKEQLASLLQSAYDSGQQPKQAQQEPKNGNSKGVYTNSQTEKLLQNFAALEIKHTQLQTDLANKLSDKKASRILQIAKNDKLSPEERIAEIINYVSKNKKNNKLKKEIR
jgi:hypothetical protein